MATLNVENFPDKLYARLQQLATAENRSISDQIVRLLEGALPTETHPPQGETRKSVTEILEESRRRREQLPTDLGMPDSTLLIREDRDR
jgi:plasmid stability protein